MNTTKRFDKFLKKAGLTEEERKEYQNALSQRTKEKIEEMLKPKEESKAYELTVKSLQVEAYERGYEQGYKRGYEKGKKDILEEMRLGKQRAIFNNGTECRMIKEKFVILLLWITSVLAICFIFLGTIDIVLELFG